MKSQAGQDFWLAGEVFCQKRNGYFVDVGAHDGYKYSNTYYLEKTLGWSGVCVEAHPEIFFELRRNRECLCMNYCVDGDEGKVKFACRGMVGGIIDTGTDNEHYCDGSVEMIEFQTRTLQSILEEADAPGVMDYLSVDTEGAEERVLRGFRFDKYRFRAMTIERPSVQLITSLIQNGYVLVKTIPGLDCFFIHESFADDYRNNAFKFYQGYDIRFGLTGRGGLD